MEPLVVLFYNSIQLQSHDPGIGPVYALIHLFHNQIQVHIARPALHIHDSVCRRLRRYS